MEALVSGADGLETIVSAARFLIPLPSVGPRLSPPSICGPVTGRFSHAVRMAGAEHVNCDARPTGPKVPPPDNRCARTTVDGKGVSVFSKAARSLVDASALEMVARTGEL